MSKNAIEWRRLEAHPGTIRAIQTPAPRYRASDVDRGRHGRLARLIGSRREAMVSVLAFGILLVVILTLLTAIPS